MKQYQKDTVDIIAVAKAANVSASTVSRAFNHPNLVKLTTRKRIERAVEKLGYIRNRAAQAMHGKRSGTIGLVVPTVNHTIFAELIQSFSEAVEELGFTILIASHGFDLDKEYSVLRKLLEHRVDGIALIGLDHKPATFQLIAQQDVPALAMWNFDEQSPISCVGSDNRVAGETAAKHLINLGHRKISVVFPPTGQNDRARFRLAGTMKALEDSGISVPQDWHMTSEYSIARAKAACMTLLQGVERPTSILCGNDVIAQGAIYAAWACGLTVPNDLSIIGIGDFAGSEELEPALTTVRIPARRIGGAAGKLLAAKIADDQEAPITRQEFSVELLARATTKPLRT